MARGLIAAFAPVVAVLLLLTAAPGQAQTSASDFTSAMRYDDAGRVTGSITTDPDGAGGNPFLAVRNSYDTAGRLIKVETGTLSAWQADSVKPQSWTGFTVNKQVDVTYDGFDRKLMETASSGGTPQKVTQYSYDTYGHLECTAVRMTPSTLSGPLPGACAVTTVPAPNGQDRITKNVYDAAGQLIKVQKAYDTSSKQDHVSYSYSLTGKQTVVIDANGNRAAYEYDGFDRLIKWKFPSKTTLGSTSTTDYEAYTYDDNGNRLTLRKRDGKVVGYSYDNLNRVIVKDSPDGGTVADVYYGYDLRGLQLYARFASGAGLGITNAFDGFGRVVSTSNNMGAAVQTLGYEYDANGNRTKLTYPDGAYFTYVYDKLDRLTTIKESGSTTIVSTVYDTQGQLATQTRGAVTTTYGFDGISRLTSLSDNLTEPVSGPTSDVTSTFTYSPANQVTVKTRSNGAYAFTGYVDVSRAYTTNALNQYVSAVSTVTANFTYDDNGNLTGDGSNTYGYDVENRMTSATMGGVAVTVKYDPLGRLWQLVTPSKTLEFVHDGDSIVKEYNGASPVWYIHGPGNDDPMIQYQGSLATRYSLQVDAQGSIVSWADASGTMYRINTYDEYGITPSANIGRFQYTGQAWLAQLGLYYYKARMYSPTLGRFMQIDPIGYADQINLYAYVGADPMNNTDPTGTTCEPNANGRGFSCIVDDRGDLTDKEYKAANKAYTDAVNDLLKNPDKIAKIKVGKVTIEVKAGDIAERLKGAWVQAGPRSDTDRATTEGGTLRPGRGRGPGGAQPVLTLNRSTLSMDQNKGDQNIDRDLERTFVHEGIHMLPEEKAFEGMYRSNGDKFNRDHNEPYTNAAAALIGW